MLSLLHVGSTPGGLPRQPTARITRTLSCWGGGFAKLGTHGAAWPQHAEGGDGHVPQKSRQPSGKEDSYEEFTRACASPHKLPERGEGAFNVLSESEGVSTCPEDPQTCGNQGRLVGRAAESVLGLRSQRGGIPTCTCPACRRKAERKGSSGCRLSTVQPGSASSLVWVVQDPGGIFRINPTRAGPVLGSADTLSPREGSLRPPGPRHPPDLSEGSLSHAASQPVSGRGSSTPVSRASDVHE